MTVPWLISISLSQWKMKECWHLRRHEELEIAALCVMMTGLYTTRWLAASLPCMSWDKENKFLLQATWLCRMAMIWVILAPAIACMVRVSKWVLVITSAHYMSFSAVKSLMTVNSDNHYHNRFTALFPGLPGWAGAKRELLDFMVQGKINRGRQTGHPAGRHSIRTKQCQPPPSPIFFTSRMPLLPPNQQCQSTEGN